MGSDNVESTCGSFGDRRYGLQRKEFLRLSAEIGGLLPVQRIGCTHGVSVLSKQKYAWDKKLIARILIHALLRIGPFPPEPTLDADTAILLSNCWSPSRPVL